MGNFILNVDIFIKFLFLISRPLSTGYFIIILTCKLLNSFMQTPLIETLSHDLIVCQWCGQPAQIFWFHGHGQCSVCGTNIDECCRGEQRDDKPSNLTNSIIEKINE